MVVMVGRPFKLRSKYPCGFGWETWRLLCCTVKGFNHLLRGIRLTYVCNAK